MAKGAIVMVGLGKPPMAKSGPPPKFGGERPLTPEKKPLRPPVSEQPQETGGDPAAIEALAALADHMNLPKVAAKIRAFAEEATETPGEENAEHASGEESMDE